MREIGFVIVGFILGAWVTCEGGLPAPMKCGSTFWCGGALNPCPVKRP